MLSKIEKNDIQEIQNKYYMQPVIAALEKSVRLRGIKETFSHLHDIITAAKNAVLNLINQRKSAGKIKDEKQASKTVVGAIFSNAIVYLFLQAKNTGLVRDDIFITSKSSRFKDLVAIKVGDWTQKPDLDLVIYSSADKGKTIGELIIISLKTSLRERAGQTYKWKLLLEIATSENSIKEKYKISYPHAKMPKVCFATVNFYNEMNNPQHRGMFQFFDKAFIGKPIFYRQAYRRNVYIAFGRDYRFCQ